MDTLLILIILVGIDIALIALFIHIGIKSGIGFFTRQGDRPNEDD